MGTFKKGLFLGGLAGAAMMWLSTTKKGRETREKMMDQAEQIYEELKDKVMDPLMWQNMSESKYVTMVQNTVDKYAEKFEWSEKMRDKIVRILRAQWRHMQREMIRRQIGKE